MLRADWALVTEGQAFYTHTDGRRQWEHPAPPAEETPPETDDAEKPADVKPTNAAVASKEEEEVPLQHCCHTTATPEMYNDTDRVCEGQV